jgi:hypothetical protein
MKKPIAIAALAVLASSAVASEGQWYGYGGFGASGYAQADDDLGDAVFAKGAGAYGATDRSAGAVKLGAGYRFNESWGAEGGVLGAGTFRRTVVSGGTTETRDLSASALYFAATRFFPVGQDRDKDFYLRFGLASWKVRQEAKTNGALTAQTDERGGSLTLGLGFAAKFTTAASVFIDYDILSTRIRDGGPREQAGFGILNMGIKGEF